MKRIDAHQHFWNYSASEYGWIEAGSPIERSFAPKDLKPLLDSSKLDACIAVQARQSLEENDYLCSLASAHDFIVGVVGWIDLQSEQAADQAQRFAEQPKSVGVRHVVQDETDPDFMKRPRFRQGIQYLHAHGLVYDILIYEHQLLDAISLVKDFPKQSFVLDHIAKPKIASSELSPWRENMRTLSQLPNVAVKVSGMLTEADHRAWREEQIRPYFDCITDLFSPQRLMFGSDWPVLNLAATYPRWLDLVENWTRDWSEDEKNSFFGGTASRIYRISG